jgi:hypothetical protein
MKPKFVIVAAVLAAGIGLAACGTGHSSPSGSQDSAFGSYEPPTGPAAPPPAAPTLTVGQVAGMLIPLGCHASPDTSTEIGGGITPKARQTCTINGENVSIDEYITAEQVAYNMKLAKTVGCSIAKQMGFTGDQQYILASNVMMTADTPGTAQKIRNTVNAVGGNAKITTVHCGR